MSDVTKVLRFESSIESRWVPEPTLSRWHLRTWDNDPMDDLCREVQETIARRRGIRSLDIDIRDVRKYVEGQETGLHPLILAIGFEHRAG